MPVMMPTRWTEPMSKTDRPNPMTTANLPSTDGYGRCPAPPYEECPKCHSANQGTAVNIWRVGSAQGATGECDGCGHAWRR